MGNYKGSCGKRRSGCVIIYVRRETNIRPSDLDNRTTKGVLERSGKNREQEKKG
ncbi:MAG: hypothetical protein R3321_09700 [Nitrososphaeraceae archaeon]|nr:hypothetical protein [Nitrososphaeraceae archaeon]